MKLCPYCSGHMEDAAVVCNQCGRNWKTGVGPPAAETETTQLQAPPGATSTGAKPGGVEPPDRMLSLLIGAAFSVFYVSLYPILVGGFVIYHYPYWPASRAMIYIAGGILVQAWCCFRPRRPASLRAQVVAGALYTAAIEAFPGTIYQS